MNTKVNGGGTTKLFQYTELPFLLYTEKLLKVLPQETQLSPVILRSSGCWVAGVVTIYSAVLPGLNHHPTVICRHETETWREDTLLKSDMLGFKMQTVEGNSTSTPGTSRRLVGEAMALHRLKGEPFLPQTSWVNTGGIFLQMAVDAFIVIKSGTLGSYYDRGEP